MLNPFFFIAYHFYFFQKKTVAKTGLARPLAMAMVTPITTNSYPHVSVKNGLPQFSACFVIVSFYMPVIPYCV